MDPIQFLTELLERTNPGAIAWIVPAGALTKLLVDFIKRQWKNLQGNVIQTVTAGVSILATYIQMSIVGVFNDGFDMVELRSSLIVSGITWLTAIGINEIFKNRNEVPNDRPE